jgi:hypothetical protein
MQFRNGWMAITALAASTVVIGSAHATDYVYDGGGTGAWTDPLAWNLDSGYPNSVHDKATINAGLTTPVVGGTITVGELVLGNNRAVVVGSSGLLIIDRGTSSPTKNGSITLSGNSSITVGSGGVLEIKHNSAAQKIGSGVINLNGNGKLLISESATLGPDGGSYGSVVGASTSTPVIEIADGKRLVNRITITGELEVTNAAGGSTGILVNKRDSTNANSGVVSASSSGTLTLGPDVDLEDEEFVSGGTHYLPLWSVEVSSSATLKFQREVLDLIGDFSIEDCGTIDLDGVSVVTAGSLLNFEGTIVVDSNETLQLDGSLDAFNGPATYTAPVCQ